MLRHVVNDAGQIKLRCTVAYNCKLGMWKRFVTSLVLRNNSFLGKYKFNPVDFPRLQTVVASGCHIRDVEIEMFSKLKSLDLRSNPVTDISCLRNICKLKLGGPYIKKIPTLPNLEYLEMDKYVELTDIDPLPKIRTIQYISQGVHAVCNTNIVNSMLDNKTLTSLNISGVLLVQGNVNLLGASSGTLKYLNISATTITDVPALPNLVHLDISMKGLVKVGCLPSLELLIAHNCHIEMPEYLNETFPKLRELDISDNFHIIEVPTINTLEIVNISSTNISIIPDLPNLKRVVCKFCLSQLNIPKHIELIT